MLQSVYTIKSRLKVWTSMTFIECVNTRYVNCLYTVVFHSNAGELHNLYIHVTPDPSALGEGVGHPD